MVLRSILVLGGLSISTLIGCVELDRGHCIVNGGDLACRDEQVCVVSIEVGQTAPDERSNGCADPRADPDRFVRVPHGLPAGLGRPGDEGFDTVAGVLAGLDFGCTITQRDLDGLRGAWQGIVDVRRHLLQRPRARASAFDLEPGHVQALRGFSSAIEAWGRGCVPEATGTGTDTGTSTSGSSTGDEGSSSTGGGCVDDVDCEGALGGPYCDPASGRCVECGGSDPDRVCASLDPSRPLCVDGTCGECREAETRACDEQSLVCELGTGTCVGCTAHEQCSSGACDRALARCMADDVPVLHVDGDGGQPFDRVGAAIDGIAAGGRGIVVLHEQDGDAAYLESVVIDAGKTVVLRGASDEQPRLTGTTGAPSLSVLGAGTTAYVDRLWLVDNLDGGAGLLVEGAVTWIDRSRITGNPGAGVRAQAAAELVLHDCFVGIATDELSAVDVDGASARIVYSSLGGGEGTAIALSCRPGSTVQVRNSILLARTDADELDCAGALVQYSATERDRGPTNVDLGSASAVWFVDFLGGDFHLGPDAPAVLATTARWEAGDPFTDIDGDARPHLDGSMDYAGADVSAR